MRHLDSGYILVNVKVFKFDSKFFMSAKLFIIEGDSGNIYSRVVLTKIVTTDDAELYQPVNGKTSFLQLQVSSTL